MSLQVDPEHRLYRVLERGFIYIYIKGKKMETTIVYQLWLPPQLQKSFRFFLNSILVHYVPYMTSYNPMQPHLNPITNTRC